VTKALIAINVIIYIAELATGGDVNGQGSRIYVRGVLWAPFVADGEYYRMITAAFLHYGPFHLLLNMLALWWFGSLLEQRIGSGRFLLLYLVSGLAGSAGALLLDPLVPTVGASGAIFGILGAGLVMEQFQRDYVFGGSALGVIVLNLVFTFSISNISIGGHIGGLIGGAAAALGLSRFGRAHIAYGRPGLLGIAAMVAIGAASVLIAYLKVRGYSV
jgi:membrane associated rhomboid family serine protease